MRHFDCLKKKVIPVITAAMIFTCLLCLSGCGNIASAPEPTATPVPVLTLNGEEVSADAQEINYSGDVAELVSAATQLQALKTIHLEKIDLSAEDIAKVQDVYPDAVLSFNISFHGVKCTEKTSSLDLTDISSSEITEAAALLKILPELKTVALISSSESAVLTEAETADTAVTSTVGTTDTTGMADAATNAETTENTSGMTFEDYETLYNARPDVSYSFAFDIFGKTVTQDTDTLKYKKVSIGDEGLEKIREYLSYLPNLTYVSFDRCDTSCDACASLREAFPDKKIEWRVYFGEFTIMTDEEKIWAIGSLTDADMDELKYCTELKYVDLGHNMITKIDFVRYWPNLEVLIVACTSVDDITPLEDCPNLEFLELTVSQVKDISVLAKCKNLKHLEISQLFELTDISPVFDLDLERFHAMADFNVPQEQKDEFVKLHPDCDVDFNPTDDPFQQSDWRYSRGYDGGDFVPRYALLREQIGYDDPYGDSRLYDWKDDE